jgi:hypothetical protein
VEIFDAISKMSDEKAQHILSEIDLKSSTAAEILEKGDIRDIKRMQNEFSTSLGTFLKLAEKDWNKISSKRKREIYDIYEEIIGGKEDIEEVLSSSTSSASKFLKLAYVEKYK